jgi:hypothetical protein
MKEQSIIEVGESRPGWEALETYAREGIRRLLQHMLEEEVEEAPAPPSSRASSRPPSGTTTSPTPPWPMPSATASCTTPTDLC